MRPRSEVREALLEAARQLAQAHGGATWRQIASAATLRVDAATSWAGEAVQQGVAPGLAAMTIKNMVRAGELELVGREKPAGSRHWVALYAPTNWGDEAGEPAPAQLLTQCWAAAAPADMATA